MVTGYDSGMIWVSEDAVVRVIDTLPRIVDKFFRYSGVVIRLIIGEIGALLFPVDDCQFGESACCFNAALYSHDCAPLVPKIVYHENFASGQDGVRRKLQKTRPAQFGPLAWIFRKQDSGGEYVFHVQCLGNHAARNYAAAGDDQYGIVWRVQLEH